MRRIIIAIDGPAGSGKTTTAKIVAEKLNYVYIDTGAMYRAVTYAWIESGLDLKESLISDLMQDIEVELRQSPVGQRTLLNGKDISEEIRLPQVTQYVSPVSAMQAVRDKMVAQQRILGESGGVVMDGRDIGTTVFPKAQLKIYLTASTHARASRRQKELHDNGTMTPLEEVKEQIIARDKYDSSRAISPLRKADDAIEIDTSHISIEEQSNKIIELAEKIFAADNS